MSKIDRTRGVIAAVVAAGERVRREAEHEDDDEEAFAKRERRRLVKDKGKIECVTVGGSFGGGGFGGDPDDPDALPGGWETLAGMAREIRTLKELALLPLVYPEAFERLGVSPGRGVLLHGPPGTGKTAAVKALLGAAARGPRPVSFFSRKGADCLGKYMGEAERSLRLLFQEAERRQPSIVFFDEIDGLAPARKAGGGARATPYTDPSSRRSSRSWTVSTRAGRWWWSRRPIDRTPSTPRCVGRVGSIANFDSRSRDPPRDAISCACTPARGTHDRPNA